MFAFKLLYVKAVKNCWPPEFNANLYNYRFMLVRSCICFFQQTVVGDVRIYAVLQNSLLISNGNKSVAELKILYYKVVY